MTSDDLMPLHPALDRPLHRAVDEERLRAAPELGVGCRGRHPIAHGDENEGPACSTGPTSSPGCAASSDAASAASPSPR